MLWSSRLANAAAQDVALDVISKMETDVVGFDQCHILKYSPMAVELGLVTHGGDGCHERPGYKNALSDYGQVEDLTVVKGRFGVLEMMLCRRGSSGDLLDVTSA